MSNEDIQKVGEELGKSLSKIMFSPKYDNFTPDQCIEIIDIASKKCKELLKE